MDSKKKVGRPKAPEQLRKVQIGIKLPQWLVNWIATQPESGAVLIERALCKEHLINPPKV